MIYEMTHTSARTFLHPIKRTRVDIQLSSRFWALLLGPTYFAVKGIWLHALTFAALVLLSVLIHPVFTIAVWLAYSYAAPQLIIWSYRKRGWEEFMVTERPAF